MKKWMTVFAMGGLLSSAGAVETSTTEAAQSSTSSPDTAPCPWCCPIEICGFNGPSFDGTTIEPECVAD